MNPDTSSNQKLVVGEETPEGNLAELHALLGQTRSATSLSSLELLRWKYLQNPDGTAVVWTLRRADSGQLVGFTACVPRRIWVRGRIVIAWNGADFSVDQNYRTLGPALLLRRQARAQIDSGRVDFLYAHPNQRMAIVHRRSGHQPLGRMVRLARLLTLKSKLMQRTRLRLIQQIAGWVIDPALRAASRARWGGLRDIEVLDPLVFDARFDELFDRQTHIRSILGVRDSRYLNWRWGTLPLPAPTVLAATEDRRIVGFLVLTDYRGRLEIRDLFPASNFRIASRLISAALKLGIDRGFSSISITLLENNPLIEICRKRRFSLRDDCSESFVYARPELCGEHSVASPGSWYMVSGDRDI